MSQSLDIAFFVSGDGRSGTFFRYHNLGVALVRRGHAVTIYSQSLENRDICREENHEGVLYVLTPSVPLNSYISFALNPGNILRRLFTSMQKREALTRHQVLHLFQPFENSSCPWLWERLLRNEANQKKKNVLFAWDWDDLWCGGLLRSGSADRLQDRLHYRLMNKLEHTLPRVADVVTTCSVFLADLALKRGAVEVEVIHNGFWPALAADMPESRFELRRRFSLDPEAFYLAFTGFTPGEFDWCLDLLARFTDDPRIRFVCCGADARQAIAARSGAIAAKIDDLGLLSSADTRQLLHAVNVGLLPLDQTPFNESRLPIKFAEYLAAGLPVLCSDVGEVGRLARKLKGVMLLPAERHGWVDAGFNLIRDLLANRIVGQPDLSQLVDVISWPVMAAQLERIYLRHLQGPGLSAPAPSMITAK
jgi:glycosyltransferase involved in cell wall biosynthesis